MAFRCTYELCAEGHFTAHDIVAIISKVTGRQILAEEISSDEHATELKTLRALQMAVARLAQCVPSQ